MVEYKIDNLWEIASDLKATYSQLLSDAYAVAAAKAEDNDKHDVTLLVGADDDYDISEEEEEFRYLIERFRNDSA